MPQITIRQAGGLGTNKNTACEYDNEVSFDLLEHKLRRIAEAIGNQNQYSCYLVGMGGMPKSTYTKLKKKLGEDVVWSASLLPIYVRLLSYIVASYAGLVKVSKSSDLPELFTLLVEQSMVGLFVFPKEYELEFITKVKQNPLPESGDFGVKKFDDYFFYVVDADSSESKTGVYEVVSYGRKANYISSIL